jgi:flagellar motor switch protein FliN/FliY
LVVSDALAGLGEAAAAALLDTLAELGVDDVQQGAVAMPQKAGSAFDGFDLPVQAATVADGSFGRATFVLTQSGATRLASAAAGDGQPDIAFIGQAMSALAGAAASVLAGDYPPPPAEARLVTEQDPAETWDARASVAVVSLTICDEPAAIVLVVPADLADRLAGAPPVVLLGDGEGDDAEGAIAGESLKEVKVRLWAELGRTRMALGRAVGLAPGEVVELDAAVDDPVIIFVNGVRLGSGHLVVGDDGEWAFRVSEVSANPALHRQLEGNAAAEAEQATVERNDA